MRAFALIPVNRLSEAKTRLAKEFSKEERAELVMCMVRDVLDAVSGLMEVVIISENDVRDKLSEYNFHFILEEKRDLDNAVYLATEYATEKKADATLFIPADIPLIKRSHVEAVLRLGKRYQVVIAPSKDGGTGVLFRKPPNIIEGKFSRGSFAYHVSEAEKKRAKTFVFESTSLSLDIDTPEDVNEFMNFGSGTRTYAFFAEKLKSMQQGRRKTVLLTQ